MKRFGILLMVGAGVLAAAALLSQSVAQTPARAAARPTRVGVCDVVAVFNGYRRAKDLSAEFDKKTRQIQAEGQKRDNAITQLQERLDSLVPGSKEYDARLAELWQKSGDATVWLDVEKRKIVRQRVLLTQQMYKEVLHAIAETAKQRGFDIVIHRDSGQLASQNSVELLNKIALRKCLYASPETDLTQAALKRVNEIYSKRPG